MNIKQITDILSPYSLVEGNESVYEPRLVSKFIEVDFFHTGEYIVVFRNLENREYRYIMLSLDLISNIEIGSFLNKFECTNGNIARLSLINNIQLLLIEFDFKDDRYGSYYARSLNNNVDLNDAY